MIPPQSLLDPISESSLLIKSEDDIVKLEIAETEAYLLGKGAGPNGPYNPYNPSPVPYGLCGYAPPGLAQRPLRAQQDRDASSLCIPVSQSSSSAQNGQEDVKMDPVQRISGVSSDSEYGSIKREKGGLYWSCHQCGQKGMTPKQLREHVRTSHWVPCLSCGTYCKDAKQLQQHYMKMHSIEGLACKICQKVYSTRRKLQIHNRRVHTSNPKYRCDVCNYTARSKYRLQVHKRKHSGVKPLLCVHCGKGYADPSNLNKHIKKAHGHGR